MAAEKLGDGAGGAGAEERIEDHVARIGGADDDAVEQGFGLLRRMRLAAVFALQAFAA